MEMQQASVKKASKTAAKGKQAKMKEAQSPERERMIAEAAYYHAQQRGFAAGCDLDDWLQAEREVSQFI